MADTVEQVKEKLDIADFVREYVKLTPAGKNLKGLCPFHKEKTPSFIVSPDRQSWHCFGCGIGGDAISFLMKYENMEFIDALRTLAEKVGIDMARSGSLEGRSYTRLYEINTEAAKFFVAHLRTQNETADKMRKYVHERGLKDETITEFGIGYAPSNSDALTSYLSKKGYAITDIDKAGLVYKTERGTYWDRFRNRIMFPLHNHFGKVIGFTGRLSPDSQETNTGKYVNSPETPIFNKSKLLFALFKSKNAIRETGVAVLVEGQMDAIMLWQAGIKNVVATSGTAITQEHLQALQRLCKTIVIFYDNDMAGQTATERVIDLASTMDISVRVIHSGIRPAEKDPADIAKETPEQLIILIEKAEPAMKYYFDYYLREAVVARADGNLAPLKQGIEHVLIKIYNLASHVEQAHWIRELAHLVSFSEEVLFEEMKRVSASIKIEKKEIYAQNVPVISIRESFSRRELIAQRFIGLVMSDDTHKEKAQDYRIFLPEDYQIIFDTVMAGDIVFKTLPVDLKNLADVISFRSSLELEGEAEGARFEFSDVVTELKKVYAKEAQAHISQRIIDAEASGDETALADALKEFDRITKEGYNT